MCLADFESYMDAHERMDKVYRDQREFARMSLVNISEAGRFASDNSIENYAKNIWNLQKIKVNG